MNFVNTPEHTFHMRLAFKFYHYSELTSEAYICDMIYSMEAKVGISKVEIQVKIGCGGEFWQK